MSIAEPVFIVGCIRSGTTIIHKTLMSYCPRAVDIDDVDFECRTFWQQRGFPIGSPKTGTHCHSCDGTDISDAVRSEIVGYFERRASGDRHIINKNPHLCNKIGLIHAIFSNARIVHIVREDMSVVASTKLRFQDAYEGRNFLGLPFLGYWPADDKHPCWATPPVAGAERVREPLRRRVKHFLRQRGRGFVARHDDPAEFRRAYPDPSRYYPGAGFRRIPESWLRINADVIRQVRALGIEKLYLPINYAELVGRTGDTLRRIAAFCGVDATDESAIPASLDESRREKWRKNLTDQEQRDVAAAIEEFGADARLLKEAIPEPLFAGRAVGSVG